MHRFWKEMEALGLRLKAHGTRSQAWRGDSTARAQRIESIPASARQQLRSRLELARDRLHMETVLFADWRDIIRTTRLHSWRSIVMPGMGWCERSRLAGPQPSFEAAVLLKSVRWYRCIAQSAYRVKEMEYRLWVSSFGRSLLRSMHAVVAQRYSMRRL
jgi:hypothetical protein